MHPPPEKEYRLSQIIENRENKHSIRLEPYGVHDVCERVGTAAKCIVLRRKLWYNPSVNNQIFRAFGDRLRSSNVWHIAILCLVLSVNAAFGFPRLIPYSAVDEPYWTFDRTPDFWRAVKARKWKQTDVNDKPGITVALLSGVGLLTIDPMPYKPLREEPKTDAELQAIDTINAAFRLPIFLFALLSLPVFYWLIRKAIGGTVAIISVVGIGLSPILLGISLIINPDSLLWIFLPIALLSHLAFLKTARRKFLLLAGVSTGLSLLTKYVANVLFVFFFIAPFIHCILSRERPRAEIFVKRAFLDLAILIGISVLTFTALYPATWVKPQMILEGTVLSAAFKSTWPLFAGAIVLLGIDAFFLKGKIMETTLSFAARFRRYIFGLFLSLFMGLAAFTIFNTWFLMKWFDFESFVMSPKNSEETETLMKSFGSILSDFYSLVFGIHPILLGCFFVALLAVMFRRIRRPQEEMAVISFSFFLLLYYVGSTANYVIATVRYQIALFPLAIIIAAIGLSFLIERAEFLRTSPAFRKLFAVIFLVAILSMSLLSTKPHYLAYASSLLPRDFILNFKDMGDGSYEAASYLNSLPDARSIRIWSDKGAVCAAFIGDCSVSFNQKRLKSSIPDYIVLSTGRKRKTVSMWSSQSIPIDFKAAYETAPADFVEILDRRPDNFVKVVDVKHVLRQNDR